MMWCHIALMITSLHLEAAWGVKQEKKGREDEWSPGNSDTTYMIRVVKPPQAVKINNVR